MDRAAYVLWLMAVATLYLQRFLLRHEERLSSKQLAGRYGLRWVRRGHPLVVLGISGCLLLVFLYGCTHLSKGELARWSFLGAPALASMSITEGCIALLTGVFDTTGRGEWHQRYVYDTQRRLRWVAILETALGGAVALLGIVGFLVYR